MNRRTPSRRSGQPAGFTLVELLVVIAIIGILSAIVLGALSASQSAARVDKTRATISKLNSIVLQIYNDYRYRRVPIDTSGANPSVAARVRLDALRDIIRMEMPDRWFDVTDNPFSFGWGSVPRPALSQAYLTRYTSKSPSNTFEGAECLYMIVTMADPENRAQFSDDEIGDVDGDGCPEFIDGWGNPIYFLRWAPGFTESDTQRVVTTASIPQVSWTDPAVVSAKDLASTEDHDPFDVQRIEVQAWRLTPLIISAGPDGIYDISFSMAGGYHFNGNPYADAIGVPADTANTNSRGQESANNSLDHYDNIHNHRLEIR